MNEDEKPPGIKNTETTSASLQQSFHAEERKRHPREQQGQFPVVGVGASAGGVESFTQLLAGLPANTGMAFVFIQHLSPKHESLLPSILSRVSQMEVISAQTELVAEPNKVYVIPPNVNMGIINGVLRLLPRASKYHRPIDFFFRCLADDQSRLAIGVVLSGADSDGAQGLRAIKSQGGLTFVQSPNTAKVEAMPRNAIAAGGTDGVLSIDQIIKELIYLGQHAFSQPDEQNRDEDPAHLAEIFRIVRHRTNVDFSGYKPGTISRRLRRRVLLQQSPSVADYIAFLEQSPAEVDALFEDFLINVTSFFRDGDAFNYLRTQLFPKLLTNHDKDIPFRIWVAGCATGEEAYSLAMTVAEAAEELKILVRVQIFASDLSLTALEMARTGIYHSSIATDVSPERLRRFFIKVPLGYQIIPALRAQCVFARHDVTRDPPFSKMNFVSCRNLLIYFSADKQKVVINLLSYALNPGAHLFLGGSETPGTSNYFRIENKDERVYRRSGDVHRMHLDVTKPEPLFTKASLVLPSRHASPTTSAIFEQHVSELLSKYYVPAGLLVGSNMQILQFRGATGDYLEPSSGDATLNLFKMARPGLDTELRILMREVEKLGKPKRKEKVKFTLAGVERSIAIEILPVVLSNESSCYMVMFDERAIQDVTAGPHSSGGVTDQDDLRAMQLELANTRDYLQTIIRDQDFSNEELQSANEEILSSNEELQSTNEELETAKEELQATNEELTTVNDELEVRNTQLMVANDDLHNLHGSVNIPIVMVDTDLRIRRFTPSAERLLGFIASDLGRPIGDLRIQLSIDGLEHHIRDTIRDNRVKEIVILSRGDRRYQLRIRPYRSTDGRVNGAVLVFVDMQALPDFVQFSTPAFLDELTESILFLDHTFHILHANFAFVQSAREQISELVGKSFFDIGEGRFSSAIFRALMNEVSLSGTKVVDFKLDQSFITAQRVHRNGEPGVLVIITQA